MNQPQARAIPPNQFLADYIYLSFLAAAKTKLLNTKYMPATQTTLEGLQRDLSLVIHPNESLVDLDRLMAGEWLPEGTAWCFRRAQKDRYDLNTFEVDLPPRVPYFDPNWSVFDNSVQRYAGVGSRETPDHINELMRKIGMHYCDQGIVLSSGFARNADQAFYAGARRSKNFSAKMTENYLAWDGIEGAYHDPENGIYDFQRFKDSQDRARLVAEKARGSFEGLGRGGISLHTRNAAQVLGPNIDRSVGQLICYAQPFSGGRVSGGTNTAVMIARDQEIEVINLAIEEHKLRMMQMVSSSDRPNL